MAKADEASEYERPQVFWDNASDDDDEPEPLAAPIDLVTVLRVARSGEKETIDTVQPGALPDVNAIRERYGPGLYTLIGRSARGRLVARVTHTIGAIGGAAAAPSAPGAAPVAANTNGSTLEAVLATMLSTMVQQNNNLATALAKMGVESGSQVTSVVAELSKARLVDQSDLYQTLLKSKGGGGGGGSEVAAYKDGMAKMLEFLEAANAGGGEGGEDDETKKIDALVRGLEAWARVKHGNGENKTPAGTPTQ